MRRRVSGLLLEWVPLALGIATLAILLNSSWVGSEVDEDAPPVHDEAPAASPETNEPESEASEASVPPGDPGEPEGPVLFAARDTNEHSLHA